MNSPEKYGDRYKEARRLHIQDKGYASEVSGNTKGTLHSHHTHPQSLGFFQYGDYRDALLMVTRGEHEAIHYKIAKSKKYLQMIDERSQTAKKLWRDPDNESLKEKIRELDRELIPAYIEGIMRDMDMSEEHIYQVIYKTLINAFALNRDLMIDIHGKETQVQELKEDKERLEKTIEQLKKDLHKRIDEVMDTKPKQNRTWLE